MVRPGGARRARGEGLRRAALAAALVVAAAGCGGTVPTATSAPAGATSAPAAGAPGSPAATPTTVRGGATAAPAADLPAGIDPAARCYVEAVNAQDLDRLVSCFAPDAVIIDVNRRIAGADAIRAWAGNEVIGGNLRVLEDNPRPGGTRLLVHWAPRGSSGWRAWYSFDSRDGRIVQADLQYA